MNDGTGAVAGAVAVAVVTGGVRHPGLSHDGTDLDVRCRDGDRGLGRAGGLTVYRFASDWRIEVSVSLIIAYGCFFIAQSAEASGVLAAMTAGFILGNWGPRWRLERESSHTLRRWWEFAAYFVNGFVFLLIGLVIDWRIVLDRWPLVLATFALTLAARADHRVGRSISLLAPASPARPRLVERPAVVGRPASDGAARLDTRPAHRRPVS